MDEKEGSLTSVADSTVVPFVGEDEIPPSLSDALVIETPAQLEEHKDRLRSQYRKAFASEDEYTYFCMLPIPERDREKIFTSMVENKIKEDGTRPSKQRRARRSSAIVEQLAENTI